MHIGIVSHVSTVHLAEYLHLKGGEPSGTSGATAPNLLIIELLKRGYKVSVFALTTDLKVGEEYTVQGNGLNIYYGAYRRPKAVIFDLFKKERNFLKRKILEIKPDILHAHWQYEYAWAALDSGIKTIVTCRDSPIKVLMLHKNLYRFCRMIMAYIVLKKSKYITATSSYLADELKKFGVKRKVHVIPNFEPDWLFDIPAVTVKNLQQPLVIMINNGFDKRKNVGLGIKAFQLFRKKYPLAELHLYGKSYEGGGEAFRWAKINGCNENVFYEGYADFTNLMQHLEKYTLMVHPSIEETFGNTLTESMALGVPVVAGEKSGSVPWVIGVEQKGGLLANIHQPDAIAQAMEKIVSDQNTYNNFVQSAKEEAHSRFSSQKVMEDYINFYKEVLV
ncbi:MAG: glycosyltransferase family 4 protein [Agriterribacter sp.]